MGHAQHRTVKPPCQREAHRDPCQRAYDRPTTSLPTRMAVNGMPALSRPLDQVFLLMVMLGNLDEKSLFFAAMDTATLRATAL
jgi:hypothetical protein